MKIHLETPRLILREIVHEDAPAMLRLDANPNVHRYLGGQPVKDIKQIHKIIDFIRQQYPDYGIGRWALVEKQSNQFIGWSGLKYIDAPINDKNDYYDLGYRLIEEYWRRGYATESAQAMLSYGFNDLNLNEIFAMADARNTGSINVLEKIGMKRIEEFEYENIPHYFYCIIK